MHGEMLVEEMSDWLFLCVWYGTEPCSQLKCLLAATCFPNTTLPSPDTWENYTVGITLPSLKITAVKLGLTRYYIFITLVICTHIALLSGWHKKRSEMFKFQPRSVSLRVLMRRFLHIIHILPIQTYTQIVARIVFPYLNIK